MMIETRCFGMVRLRPLIGVLGLLAVACTAKNDPTLIGTADVGESCGQIADCRAGLDCVDGACTPIDFPVTGPQRGDACTSNADCGAFVCGRQGVCALTVGLPAGSACGLTIDCLDPLVCNGTTGLCVDDDGSIGTIDVGGACEDLLDCRRPLICGFDNTCVRPPIFLGTSCLRSDEERGDFRVYFEIPPEDPDADPNFEFYRLPFPNDIRVDSTGSISMAGHASPGEVLGINVSELFFSAIEEDVGGFAINAPVFFRFSQRVDVSSICLTGGSIFPPPLDVDDPPFCAGAGEPTVLLVEIDENVGMSCDPPIPVQLTVARDAGQYICQNSLGIAPLDGRPLRQGATYAAIITNGIVDNRGDALVRDTDFASIMEGSLNVPAMDPLLDWTTRCGFDVSTIAGAAVFTTGDADAVAPKIREAVHGTAVPTFDSNSVNCGIDPGPSPCDDGLMGAAHTRGCFGTHGTFEEIQGTYPTPVLQQGQRPYARAEDGGAIAYDSMGVPIVQDTETMCYALSVPNGATPGGGYPVVIYGHGTGGSYRSSIEQGIAQVLTDLGYAVIGFDNVLHGPRQQNPGDPLAPALWKDDPGPLFFNLANPRGSRDNILQGAADVFQLVRLVRNAGVAGVTFNANQVYYLGHSQGTTIIPPVLTAEPNLEAAVLSGAGAELALSILNKTEPTDLSQVVSSFFGDQNISRVHPMMGLLAHLFEVSDSVAYAHTWVPGTVRGSPLPLLQFSGINDNFTPIQTQRSQIRIAGMPIVGEVQDSFGVSEVASPQQNNLSSVTAGAVQFQPDMYDGHFVMFRNPRAQETLRRFFETALLGDPVIERMAGP